MLSPSKVVASVFAIGISGSVGVGSYIYFNEPKEQSIEALLKSSHRKKKLVDNENKGQAKEIWAKYKEDKANDNEDWKIIDWDKENTKAEFPDSLVQVCQKRKEDKVKRVTDQAYINFVNWCTVEEQ